MFQRHMLKPFDITVKIRDCRPNWQRQLRAIFCDHNFRGSEVDTNPARQFATREDLDYKITKIFEHA
jgi:hypothetical protein